MRSRHRKLATNIVMLTAAAYIAELVNAAPAHQQGQPEYVPPVLTRRDAEMAREREVRQREELRQSLGKRPLRAANLRYVQAIIAQVKQDFERIQIARNEIVRSAVTAPALDYKLVSDLTGEIKKRASRLEGNLALPNSDGREMFVKNAGELNEAEIRVALLTLCHRIESFVKSPLFETPGVIDVQHSTKASSDLARILELSGSVRKSAERLKKDSKASTVRAPIKSQ